MRVIPVQVSRFNLRILKISALCWVPVLLAIGTAHALGGVGGANDTAALCGIAGLVVGGLLTVRLLVQK